jgi:lysophospholipase L1-like esterase
MLHPASRTVASMPVSRAATIPRPVAAFLGDSYTSGWAGAGVGRAGWPAIVGGEHGWRVKNYAVAGTGFVNPGWTGQPMRTRIQAVLRLQPGVVFVAGGHNDRRYGSSRAGAAADSVIRHLRAGLPDALIVVVGPIWQDGRPPASIKGLRDHLRRAARAVDALFIDPISERWFAGSAHRFIGRDGIHPTNAGHRHLAARVLAALDADLELEAVDTDVELAALGASLELAQPTPRLLPRACPA